MRTRIKRLTIVGIGGIVAVAMLWLGLWQMQVFSDVAAADSKARSELPALSLDELLRTETIANEYGRSVFASGTLTNLTAKVAGPRFEGTLVGFKLASGEVLPVLVGPCENPVSGLDLISGVLLFSEDRAEARPGADLGSVRLPQLAQLWPQDVVPGYVVADHSSAAALGCPSVEPSLPTGAGPWRNAGYALQWWVFAAFALGMSILISRRID